MNAQNYCPSCGSSRGTHAAWCDDKHRLDEDELADLRAENDRLRAQLAAAERRLEEANKGWGRIQIGMVLRDSTILEEGRRCLDRALAEPEEKSDG